MNKDEAPIVTVQHTERALEESTLRTRPEPAVKAAYLFRRCIWLFCDSFDLLPDNPPPARNHDGKR